MFKHFFVYYMKDRVGEYLIREKMQKTCKKRAKTCKKRAAKVNLIKKRASQVFLDPIQNVHCQGPCSLRPCISKPY